MNAVRTKLLARLPYPAVALLRTLAQRAATSVDDVVSAALSRAPVHTEAVKAAQAWTRAYPTATRELADAWPFVCQRCRQDADALSPCAGKCGASVCHACAGGCDTCQRARIQRRQTMQQEAAERARTVAATEGDAS